MYHIIGRLLVLLACSLVTECQGLKGFCKHNGVSLNGNLFPHPKDCTQFIHCDWGVDRVKVCPDDENGRPLWFDPVLKRCEYPYSFDCSKSCKCPPKPTSLPTTRTPTTRHPTNPPTTHQPTFRPTTKETTQPTHPPTTQQPTHPPTTPHRPFTCGGTRISSSGSIAFSSSDVPTGWTDDITCTWHLIIPGAKPKIAISIVKAQFGGGAGGKCEDQELQILADDGSDMFSTCKTLSEVWHVRAREKIVDIVLNMRNVKGRTLEMEIAYQPY